MCHLPTIAVRYPAALSCEMNVGWLASIGVVSVVTPFTWLYVPVRIEARLGEQSEFVAKQLVNRQPRSAISSILGVRLTADPYAPIECAAWSSVRIITML